MQQPVQPRWWAEMPMHGLSPHQKRRMKAMTVLRKEGLEKAQKRSHIYSNFSGKERRRF
jgi:hypothetical protein